MSAQATPKIEALELSRVFAAPRERVFRAWTEAAELSRWFGPSPDYKTVVPELDLRVGGKYRLEVHHKGGNIHRISGVYREIKAPEKLVFTWIWEAPGVEDTLVTLEFKDMGGSTEVKVTHVGFTNVEDRDRHRQGWAGGLENLSKAL